MASDRFALGFVQIHQFLGRSRARLGLSRRDVWTLTLLIVVGVLLGGRLVAIAFDEWSFYREHPELMPAFWLGGMATHGLLIGAAVSTGLYALVWNRPYLVLADALVIPGAFLMGVGHHEAARREAPGRPGRPAVRPPGPPSGPRTSGGRWTRGTRRAWR